MIYFFALIALVSVFFNIVQAIHNQLAVADRDDAYWTIRELRDDLDEFAVSQRLTKVGGRRDRRARALGLIESARS